MIGSILGPYEIVDLLGEGGMGAVYRARDTRLGREVAIKILPDQFTSDPDRLARFEREARVVAQLSHSGICALFDVGGSDQEDRYLVMELIEGETLEERMARDLSQEEAIDVAVQIAEALEAAHQQGIVHRDLKPANVMITPSGQVKVLDFGLAKARESEAGASSELSHSPTLTARMTQQGVILGTAAYMSPEQARGEPTDGRTDIWSWGVLLYEMLAGERLFAEPTVSDTLAAVLRADFDWQKLPRDSSSGVRRVLRRSLERDPKNRWHAIADARIELTEVGEPEAVPEMTSERRPSKALVAAWLVATIAVGWALWLWKDSSRSTSPQRFVAEILPPKGQELLFHSGLALAPDGRALVFGARDDRGREFLWLRDLETGKAEVLPGTERGSRAFWSPNGKHIGFVTEGEVKTISLRDGAVDRLMAAGPRSSAAWGPDGTILVAQRHGIFRIPSVGGEPELVLDQAILEVEYLCPIFLPGGSHFAYLSRDYTSGADKNQIRFADLEGGGEGILLDSNSCAAIAPSGELVWWEGGHLRAQKLDASSFRLTGEERTLQTEVQFDPPLAQAMFSVASNGTLVFRRGPIYYGDQLTLVDREGSELRTIGPPGNFYYPRLSPDGRRIAVDRSDPTNRGDIWIFTLDRGTGDRITSVPQDESNPVWSPDGSQLAIYSTRVHGSGAVHLRAPRPGSEEQVVHEWPEGRSEPVSWSSRGFLALETSDRSQSRSADLVALSLEDGETVSIAATAFSEINPDFSPDGRFVLYCSDETGRLEVYLQSFPEASHRLRVSTEGGCAPSWNPAGGEVFYINDDYELLAVPVEIPSQGDPVVGSPSLLFQVDLKSNVSSHYDTLDGQTFVVNQQVHDQDATPLTLVVNAFDEGP